MIDTIQQAIKQILPAKRKTNATSGWISFNAPCCHHNGESSDTRGRGGIVMNPDGGVSYHCFNCNFKASYQPGRHLSYKFRKLLSWFGADEGTIKRLVIDAIRVKDFVAPEQIKAEPEAEIVFKARPLPEDAESIVSLAAFYKIGGYNGLPDDLYNAADYVIKRNINAVKYNLMWTPVTEHNYHKRVIVPFYWKGELIGSTARTFDDGIKPKYYSDYEPNYVYNLDNQAANRKFVIVVEGPFDAMAVDGVAVLSNECSEVQADIIDSLGKEVIVVPDFDLKLVKGKPIWSGEKLVDQALEYGWNVSFPVWREYGVKDVAEAVQKYGKLFVLKSIIAGKQSSRLKIELHKKKVYN